MIWRDKKFSSKIIFSKLDPAVRLSSNLDQRCLLECSIDSGSQNGPPNFCRNLGRFFPIFEIALPSSARGRLRSLQTCRKAQIWHGDSPEVDAAREKIGVVGDRPRTPPGRTQNRKVKKIFGGPFLRWQKRRHFEIFRIFLEPSGEGPW